MWPNGLYLVLSAAGCATEQSERTEQGQPEATTELAAPDLPPGIDLAAVMRTASLAFRPSDAGWQGGFSHYRAAVTATDVALIHSIDGAAPELRLRTTTASRVGEPFKATETRVDELGRIERHGNSVVEHLENSEAGLLQSWSFDSAPSGGGDLVVQVAVDGLPHVASTDLGQHFAEPGGAGFVYGHATWIDAMGATTEVQTSWTGEQLSMTVPATIIAESAFPAVLDPTVGPEQGVGNPVSSLPLRDQSDPTAAFDGTNHLVVWNDGRNTSGTTMYGAQINSSGELQASVLMEFTDPDIAGRDPDMCFDGTNYVLVWRSALSSIVAARISTQGEVLDPSPHRIADNTGRPQRPRVACGGSGALVVWDDQRSGDDGQYAGRLGPDASPLDGNGFPIANVGRQGNGDVASNGTDFLVVWTDYTTNNSAIKVAEVSSDGAVGPHTALSTNPNRDRQAKITYDGSQYVAVWTRSGGTAEPRYARISSAGTPIDLDGVSLNTPHSYLDVAPHSGGVLVTGWTSSGGYGHFGVRVRSDGTVVDSTPKRLTNASVARAATHSGDGSTTLLTFGHEANNRSDSDIYAVVVPNGAVVAAPDGTPISFVDDVRRDPAVGFNGSNFLVAWSALHGLMHNDYDLFCTRISPAGEVLDPSAVLVGEASGWDSYPRVASIGDTFFLAWRAQTEGNYNLVGTRIGGDGAVLDTAPIPIETGPGAPIQFDMAAGNTGYMIVWSENRFGNPAQHDLFGTRITETGTVVAPNGTRLVGLDYQQQDPQLAFDGSQFLLVWTDGRSGRGYNLYGSRLTTAGAMLDSNGFPISAEDSGIVVSAPTVVARQNDFLVAWEFVIDNSGLVDNLYGARVSSGGVVTDTGGFLISDRPSSQLEPVAVPLGTDTLVLWSDAGNPDTYGRDIYGTRIAADGTVLDADWMVAEAEADLYSPVAATSASGEVLLVYVQNDNSSERLAAHIISPQEGIGVACDIGSDCQSGACVDGVCCDNTCGDGASDDCLACTAALTGGTDGTCAAIPQGSACGDGSTSECDAADTCDGAGACVENYAIAGDSCGATGVDCFDDDTCDGLGACTDNGPSSAGTACGSDTTDACTAADTCDGAGTCDPNHADAGDACGTQGVECYDNDTCDGLGACTDNGPSTAGTTCGSDTTDACTAADTCDGAGTCDPNHVSAGNPCGDQGVTCRADDACDGSGVCNDNGLLAAGAACGDNANDSCTNPDTCSALGDCEPNHAADGETCTGTLFCGAGDSCQSGVCVDGTEPACGDGESCEEVTDTCLPACGDGEADLGEECDNGTANSDTTPDACRLDCQLPSCGDSVTDSGETCDLGDANADEPDTCRTDCQLPECGDGITDTGEGCDNGADNSEEPGADCRTDCSVATCGDGVLDPSEECDDGADNANEPNACRVNCVLPLCGDGIIDLDEECDDGDANDADDPDACPLDCVMVTQPIQGGCSTGPTYGGLFFLLPLLLPRIRRRRAA